MRGAQAWRLVITVILLLFSIYFLWPTLRLSAMSEEAKMDRPELVDQLSEKGIKLGLDLQGGMHLLLEPDLVEMLFNLSSKKDAALKKALLQTEEVASRQNKDFLEILPLVFKRNEIELTDYFLKLGGSQTEIVEAISKERARAVDGALEVIRSRIDQFGVAEPIIQRASSGRIIVELPGVQDANKARSLLKETAILEFQMVRRGKEVSTFVDKVDNLLRENPDLMSQVYSTNEEEIQDIEDIVLEEEAEKEALTDTMTESETDITETEIDSIVEETTTDEVVESEIEEATEEAITEEEPSAEKVEEKVATSSLFDEDTTSAIGEEMPFPDSDEPVSRPFSSLVVAEEGYLMVPRSEYATVEKIIQIPEVMEKLPRGTQLVWSARDEAVKGIQYRFLYLLNSRVELTGDHISKANFGFGSGTDPRSAGKPIVNLGFDDKGSRIFSQVTGANIGRRLAIVLNDQVYTAPTIKTKIPTGDAQITGIQNLDEAKMISIVLKAGALPVPLNIRSERTVGPSLGEDSIKKGVMATLIGALLVVLFVIIYYKAAGVIADFALVLNLVALMAGMAAFKATLTLPGIAGIILTIGMAVDANVLIFERIREELRTGKTVRVAIDAGYSRAFRTIVDANITTLITAAILYNFGTGPVKGFAVTLFMGIVISMITAIVVTRLIFEFVTSRRHVEKLSI